VGNPEKPTSGPPAHLAEHANETEAKEAHEAAVLALWVTGRLSARQAALELGLSYVEFLDLLTRRGIPPVSTGDLRVEL
jgi:predicted HTH domain antitoxin